MKKTILFITAAVLAGVCRGQSAINLEQYRLRVIGYSQQLKIAREDLSAAESNIKAVRTGFLPKLDASGNFSYQVRKLKFDLGPMGSMGFKQYNYSGEASVTQNVYSGSAVRNQYDAARITREIARYSEQLTIDNIIYQADVAYWNLAANRAFYDVAREYLTIIRDLYDIVQKRFQDGLISKTDLLMVETRIKEAQLQLSSAEKTYKASVINLNILMGTPVDEYTQTADSIQLALPMPGAVSLEDALDSRADYLIADRNVDLQGTQVKLARSQFMPQLGVGFNGTYGTQSLNIDGKGMWNGIAFAQLRIPIFDWSRRRHTVNMAKANLRASEYDRQNVVDQVSQELSTAWSNLNESATQLRIADSSLKIAEENLYLNTFSYNEGRLTILDVLSAQISWIQAYNSLISSNYQYKLSLSDYNKAIGLYSNF